MSDEPKLRAAGPDDAALIFRFIRELAEFEREPEAVETSPAEIAEQLRSKNPPFECLIAETDGGEPAGFALFFQNYSTWLGKPGLYLEDLYVVPRRRGCGIGRALFTRVAQIAVERGYGRYEWAALDWNGDAIDFYESFGAEPLNEWTTFRLSGASLSRAAGGNDE